MKSIRIVLVHDGETVYDKETDWKKWMKTHRRGGGSPYRVQADSMNYVQITIRDE